MLTFEMLTESGLLWKINHDLLHPLGLALAVTPQFEGGLLVAEDGIWEFTDEINEQRSQAWDEFYERVKNENEADFDGKWGGPEAGCNLK